MTRHASLVLLAIAVGVTLMTLKGSRSPAPPCPRVVVDTQNKLDEVCEETGTLNPFPFFSEFSWQSFLALVRPAGATRGEPDLSLPMGTIDRPLVFESYKATWEVLADEDAPTQPGPPADWNVKPTATPCGDGSTFDPTDLVISSFGELEDLAQAGHGPKEVLGPIVSQNSEYVRYSMGYNKTLFDAIVLGGRYLAANLHDVRFPAGSIAVKAAWMIMTPDVPHPERYYRRYARITKVPEKGPKQQPDTSPPCERRQLGLIALHIVQKTPKRLQWVWSTFEHVDNVPNDDSRGPYALNNGNPLSAMPAASPQTLGNLKPKPDPFNIFRLGGNLQDDTIAVNGQYAQALRDRRVIWSNYRLVSTQWPRDALLPDRDGKPEHTIPGTPATAKFPVSNPAIETFFQKGVLNGCMNCHDIVRPDAGFVWSLRMHAWSAPTDTHTRKERDKQLDELDKLLREAR
jgi:hypothetical protein